MRRNLRLSFRQLNDGSLTRSFSAATASSSGNSFLPFSLYSPLGGLKNILRDKNLSSFQAKLLTAACFCPNLLLCKEVHGISCGLNWALAGKGVIVNGKTFRNLKPSELHQQGATIVETLSGLPIHIRGKVKGTSEISKGQFSKLLKQVTSYMSSVSDIFVHDGAIGSLPKCDAKVRVISDNPSAVLRLSSVLWETSIRSVSHDSCPLTVYVASSISPSVGDALGIGSQGSNGYIVADIERSSLILCGKAFADANGTKGALTALSERLLCSRGGLPLSARLLVAGESVILLFAPENIVKSFSDLLVSTDIGAVLSSQGVSPLFKTRNAGGSNFLKMPSSVIIASSDSSGAIPSLSKLSPGQAAYHFLAGHQDRNFVPAYIKGPSSVDPLELAKNLLSKLKHDHISSYLINANDGEKQKNVKEIVTLVQSILGNNIPPFEPKGVYLRREYKRFLSGKFQELPKEFSF